MTGTLDLDGADSYLDALLQLYTPASAGKARKTAASYRDHLSSTKSTWSEWLSRCQRYQPACLRDLGSIDAFLTDQLQFDETLGLDKFETIVKS